MALQPDPAPRSAGPLEVARSLPLAFEAACLIRCTGVGRSPGIGAGAGTPVSPTRGFGPAPGSKPAAGTRVGGASPRSGTRAAPSGPGAAQVLAEFSHPTAAERLVTLLAEIGVPATQTTIIGGGRRQYFVHRVTVPETHRHVTAQSLDAAWRQGRHFMLRTDIVGASSPHNARRESLARRAWHAATLAAGRHRRGDILAVRLVDEELAAVLVRGARFLGATASVRSRPGCLQVTVTSVQEGADLLDMARRPATPLLAAS